MTAIDRKVGGEGAYCFLDSECEAGFDETRVSKKMVIGDGVQQV
jgi:hypothetical protein